MRSPLRISLFTALFAQLAAGSAFAQDRTQHSDHVNETAPTEDTQNWTASAGAVLNTGNTRSYAFSVGTSFAITRGRHGFSFDSAGNFGKADPQEPDPTMQVHEY